MDDRLASALRFTAEQLAANRNGQIAPGQLIPAMMSALWGGLVALTILGGGLAAIKYARGVLRVVAPSLAVAGAAILLSIVVVPALRDLRSRTVASLDGMIDSVGSAGKGRGSAVLMVGRLRLLTAADPDAARSLVGGRGRYRICYLSASERFLSLEPLPSQAAPETKLANPAPPPPPVLVPAPTEPDKPKRPRDDRRHRRGLVRVPAGLDGAVVEEPDSIAVEDVSAEIAGRAAEAAEREGLRWMFRAFDRTHLYFSVARALPNPEPGRRPWVRLAVIRRLRVARSPEAENRLAVRSIVESYESPRDGIRAGMSPADVTRVLGEPARVEQLGPVGSFDYIYPGDRRIRFLGGQVAMPSAD